MEWIIKRQLQNRRRWHSISSFPINFSDICTQAFACMPICLFIKVAVHLSVSNFGASRKIKVGRRMGFFAILLHGQIQGKEMDHWLNGNVILSWYGFINWRLMEWNHSILARFWEKVFPTMQLHHLIFCQTDSFCKIKMLHEMGFLYCQDFPIYSIGCWSLSIDQPVFVDFFGFSNTKT